MEHSTSSEADSHSASHEIPCHLRNRNVHYSLRKSPPLSQMFSFWLILWNVSQ